MDTGKDALLEKEINERFFKPQDNLPPLFHDRVVVMHGVVTIFCGNGQVIEKVMPFALQIGYDYNLPVEIEHGYAKVRVEPRMHA